MSRIGRMPVVIPAGVTVDIAEGNKVTVKGAKGTLVRELPVEMEIKIEDGHVVVNTVNFQNFFIAFAYTNYHVVDQCSCQTMQGFHLL